MNFTLYQATKKLAATLLLVAIASCSGSGARDATTDPTGTTTIWLSNIKDCGQTPPTSLVDVSIDNVSVGTVYYTPNITQVCGTILPGSITRILSSGDHIITATSTDLKTYPTCVLAPATITITTGGCLLEELK